MPLSPQDIEELKSQGIDPSQVQVVGEEDQKQSAPRAALNILKANTGKYIGGGGGAMAGAEVGGALGALGGPAAPVTVPFGALAGSFIGAYGGGYLGEKAQESVLSPETEQALQEQAAEAQKQHPYVSGITDTAASMLASGGSFSPSTTVSGIRGIGQLFGREALPTAESVIAKTASSAPEGVAELKRLNDLRNARNVVMQAGVMPAINYGVGAATGNTPSGTDTLMSAVGGALFAKPLLLGKKFGGLLSEKETTADPTANEKEGEEATGATLPNGPHYMQDSEGNFTIPDNLVKDQFMRQNPKPKTDDPANDVDYYQKLAAWNKLKSTPIDDMRKALHDKWQASQATGEPSEVTVKIPESVKQTPTAEVVNPPVTATTGEVAPASPTPKEEMTAKENVVAPVNVEGQPHADGEGPNKASENASGQTQQVDKLADFNKTRAEQVSVLHDPNQVLPQNPITANQARTINPKTLIGSVVARPEVRPPGHQSPEPTDQQKYIANTARVREMIQRGEHITADGNLTPEFQKIWQENGAIKNKNGGMPPTGQQSSVPIKQGKIGSRPLSPAYRKYLHDTGHAIDETPRSVVEHINTDKATQGSVMKLMAQEIGHEHQPLAKWLYEHMDSASRNVPVKHNPLLDLHPDPSQRRSHYLYPEDIVELTTRQLHFSPVVMEECLHGMTSAKLPKEWAGLRGAKLKSAMDDFVSKNPNHPVSGLVKAYYDTANHEGYDKILFGVHPDNPSKELFNRAGYPDGVKETSKFFGLKHGYAMGDLHEFIAHAFMDKDFQETLNKIGGQDGRTVWQRVVDAISHLLGIPVNQRSMLDRVLRSSAELIRHERESVYKPKQDDLVRKFSSYHNLSDRQRNLLRQVLIEKDENEAKQWAHQLADESDLKRRDIEQLRKDYYALQKPEASSVLPHTQEGVRAQGSEREGMGSSDKREEVTREGGQGDREDLEQLHRPAGTEAEYRRLMGQQNGRPPAEKAASMFRDMREHVARQAEPPTPEQEAIAEKAQERNGGRAVNKPLEATDATSFGKVGRAMGASVLDRIRAIGSPTAKLIANAYQKALDTRQGLIGHFYNGSLEHGEKMPRADKDALNVAIQQYQLKGTLPKGLSTKATAWFNDNKRLIDELGKLHIANKVPINDRGYLRLMKQAANYWPTMANQQTEDIFRQGTDHKAMRDKEQEWKDWYTNKLGKSPEEADEAFRTWKTAITRNFKDSGLSHQDYFNALRKAQGESLPPSFRETDPIRNMSRYFDRSSTALAHYMNVESNPKIMSSLGASKDPWGNALEPSKDRLGGNNYVKAAIDTFHHQVKDTTEHVEAGASSMATQAFIQSPALQPHIVGSNVINAGLKCVVANPYGAVRAVGQAITHMREGWAHAKEGGLVKLTASAAGDMTDISLSLHQRMAGISKLVRDISTLGGLTTKANAAYLQAYFEANMPAIVQRANGGNKYCQQMLKHWDADYQPGKTYNAQEMIKRASIAASYVHGTGDIRQMPAWMMKEGEISGFMQLAHWSVAQTNNFMHDVWTPATKGNYAPLLVGMFGTAVGGYMLKELREAIQGKHGQIPSISEIAASEKGLKGNVPLLAYNAMAAMQYAGFGGLFSQVVKYPFDAAWKNTPQGATFPLDEIATDLGKTAHQVMTAMANDPNVNYVDLAAAVGQHVLGSNIKLASIALNQGINNGMITGLPAEKKMLADKLGQLRRFDMVTGLPYNEPEEASNPYLNLEQKKFKMDEDLPSAMKQVPALVQNIIQTYSSQPDVMMNKLKALKENAYATFPSLEQMPISYMKYLSYLGREEGPQAAQAALMDYMKHKVTNEVKSSVIP